MSELPASLGVPDFIQESSWSEEIPGQEDSDGAEKLQNASSEAGFDSRGRALASSGRSNRIPPSVQCEIRWVGGQAGQAIGASQGQALRAAMAALEKIEKKEEDNP